MFQQRHFERLAETVRDAPVSEDERRRWASLLADSTGVQEV